MSKIEFIWDNKKAKYNLSKHHISFEEASTVFYDENATEYYDPDHSEGEERFLLLGMSRWLRILVVSYCYRENDDVIRIISARKAKRREMKYYKNKERWK